MFRRFLRGKNSTFTNYTFTGQYSYMDDPSTSGTEGFGLMFYQARWLRSVPKAQRKGYDPGLGRFAQADMIVPPGAQGLDRYAYVNNSPLRYVDPSGHTSVCAGSNADPECNGADTWSLPFVDAQYGITFDGNGWTAKTKKAVRTAVENVAKAFQQAYNQMCDGWDDNCPQVSSAAEAFKKVYGNIFTFTWSNEQPGNAGYTNAYNHITLYSVKDSPNYLENHMRVIVHELGHAFNQVVGKDAQNSLNANLLRDADGDHTDEYGRYYGFAGGWDNWQFGWDNTASEVFADMFIGWVYNTWDLSGRDGGLGTQRMTLMNSKMPLWLNR